jgi:hypothetical protein
MTTRRLVTVAVAAASAALVAASPASAAAPRVQVAGLGSASASTGTVTYEGWLSGRPFSGSFSGAVVADDGSLPDVGVCEPATATLSVEDEKGHVFELFSAGKVCGEYLPLGVMQRFGGRYVVTSSTQRGLERTDGFLDVRLLDGQSDVYAIDS